MKLLPKKIFVITLTTLFISLLGATTVFAARTQGSVENILIYDYTLRVPVLPWDCVQGYSNTTFNLDYSYIQSGISGQSKILASSNDGKLSANKTAYVQKGTNYARTGDIKLDGYKKDCKSTHFSRLDTMRLLSALKYLGV